MADTLSDKAYRLITKKLLTAELVPGQKISEQQLADEGEISRTPVREAIRRLTEEGVLYQIPSSGTYVARLDRHQLIDAYEVRMAIECFALERAIKNLTKEKRQELRSACDAMHAIATSLRTKKSQILDGRPLVTFLSADLSFHLLLLKAAGNDLAIKIVSNAYQRNHFFGHYSHLRDLKHLAKVWHHHAEIERAVSRGDPHGARRWMRTHIAHSMEDALAAFDQAQASAARAARAPRDPVNDALSQLTGRFV